MATRESERYFSVGNIVFPDPTAWEAIRHLEPSSKNRPAKPSPVDLLTLISQGLGELKRRRKERELTKEEFVQLHRPLADAYRALLQTHLVEGGE